MSTPDEIEAARAEFLRRHSEYRFAPNGETRRAADAALEAWRRVDPTAPQPIIDQ
jgi:hypothetical protein